MSLFRSSGTIAFFTLLSRIFGFVRDMLIATIMGASMQTDAFFVAFKLPNFMRRLFAEGAFNSAFLPMFAGMLKTEGEERSLRFASETFSYLLFVLLIVCGLCMLFMPYLMGVLAPGFEPGSEKYILTVELTRITFPYLLFISLVCLLSGMLNSYEKFAAVAAAPILLNIIMVFALLGLEDLTPGPGYALSIGVILAGIAQFVWLLYFCQKLGITPKLRRPRLTPDVKKLLTLIAPAAIGASVGQVNLLIDVIIASHMEEAISFLYYADRLYELPLGVIGVAVATALLPRLSKHIRAGEKSHATASVNQGLQLVLFFGLPSAVALITIAMPIVRAIYEHGAFSLSDSRMVAPALMAYAVGLPAFVCAKVLANIFYASQDIKTPVRIAIFCVTINVVFNLLLMGPFGHIGLAMATTISGWTNVLLLGFILHRRDMYRLDTRMIAFISKCLLCCALMSASLAGIMLLMPISDDATTFDKILLTLILVPVGGTVYAVSIVLFRVVPVSTIKGWLKRKADPASLPPG